MHLEFASKEDLHVIIDYSVWACTLTSLHSIRDLLKFFQLEVTRCRDWSCTGEVQRHHFLVSERVFPRELSLVDLLQLRKSLMEASCPQRVALQLRLG